MDLAATEIWVAKNAVYTTEDGVFVIVKDRACSAGPCPTRSETRLNSNRTANIGEIDFSASKATDEQIHFATSRIARDGVIVVGDRFYPTDTTKGRTANQFFTKEQVPLHW